MVSRKLVQRTNALLNRVEFFLHIFLGKWAMFWLFSIFPERSSFDQKLRYRTCPDFRPIRYRRMFCQFSAAGISRKHSAAVFLSREFLRIPEGTKASSYYI